MFDAPIINRIIFKAFHSIGISVDKEKKHIEIIKGLFGSENGKKVSLPYNVTAFKEYDFITLTNKCKTNENFYMDFKCGTFDVPNYGKITIKRAKSMLQESALYIDNKKIPKDCCWRFRKNGDIFTKYNGGTKKLKDYLIDKKIPVRSRDVLPVLAFKNEILVIAGVEISDKVKVDETTRSIIKIEVERK